MNRRIQKQLVGLVITLLLAVFGAWQLGDDDPSVATDSGNVIRVVDGDTIVVRLDGDDETVRMIGLNTPESVDPRQAVECFGREASSRLKEILAAATVTLEADVTQDNRDRYGRLLRYVFIDQRNINQQMIEEGYGYEYTFDQPYRYQREFRAAESEARVAGRGLWSTSTCSGKT
ncbi:MAG: thermonuclease family protein [Candidatus Kerfeldbacteria bacterium]|nr:thermonuclease family protein [Candidatus Kerfeldbacteria bacterium]